MRAVTLSGFSQDAAVHKMRRFAALAVLLAAGLSATAAWSEPSGGVKVVAIVNDQIISSIDLDDRIRLVMAMTGIADTDENRARLAPQILRQLVDEKLQLQDAATEGVTVDDAKVNDTIARIEKQNGKAPGSLEQFLDDKHAPKASFVAQIKAQAAWAEIVMKKVRPGIRISDQEVAHYTQRKTSAENSGSDHNSGELAGNGEGPKVGQVMIATILLPIDSPKNEVSVRRAAEKLAEEIHAGASFDAIASQFSSGARGARSTEPFWVEASQLDPAIGTALAKLKKGGVSGPVKTESGYQIIRLVDVDKKQEEAKPAPVASAPAKPLSNVELAFRQIILSARQKAGNWRAQLMKASKSAAQTPNLCVAKNINAGDARNIEVGTTFMRRMSNDMPANVRDVLLGLKVGGVSAPIATESGVRIYALCERAEAPVSKQQAENNEEVPSASDEAIRQAIFSEKLELEAQKYMRNLRREAFVDIRGM
ncbi:MAG TPA: peptidylprolyl isomerase [Rickettsiales bacterium]|nr:peptidylprolyl isomerase [Rickettsiales bacterium]